MSAKFQNNDNKWASSITIKYDTSNNTRIVHIPASIREMDDLREERKESQKKVVYSSNNKPLLSQDVF